jgi:hypothetical protein
MRKSTIIFAIAIPLAILLAIVIYNLPPVNERLAWRMNILQADIKYALNPPEKAVFTPSEGSKVPPTPTATIRIATPLPTSVVTTSEPTNEPTPEPSPTLSPTPVPSSAMLTGFRHEYQRWNNCGPANLAMALSYWGWEGDQKVVAPFLKPNDRDINVMPYEIEAYVEQETDLLATVRVGGDPEILKAFISAGYPVMVEKGFEGPGFDGWMGHYQVVNGYDDVAGYFVVQDSYKGPDIQIPYESFIEDWRAFNYTYIVIYPPQHRQQVLDILGLQAYDNFNDHHAASLALQETQTLNGRDLFFAWFNRGTNLVYLQDYAGAAAAYDAAFANYLQIPEKQRPWRTLWYQTGPYFAYYYTGRYQDVIDLATTTINASSEPNLEENYYWRAKALLALVDNEGAERDLRQCLKVHPDFDPCVSELLLMGIEP